MASSGSQNDSAINLDFVNIPTAATPPAAAPAVAQYSAAVQAGSGVDANFGIFSLISPSFWLAAFNVDTSEVVLRLKSALWPFRRSESFLTVLAGKPDLWVRSRRPFAWVSAHSSSHTSRLMQVPTWVPATLVAVLMFGSNLSSYLHFTESPTVPIYRADFSKLIEAAFVVYCFSVGAPALSWLALLYSGIGAVGVVSLTCLYGYSLAVYIPAAVRTTLPANPDRKP